MKRATGFGFTLLEVLVALAVLAIAMGAVIGATTQSVNTVGVLRDRTFASWVALNKGQRTAAVPTAWPDEGSRRGETELANRVWRWEARFDKTDDPDMRRLEVTVWAGEGGPVLGKLVAFRADRRKSPGGSDPAEDQTSERERPRPHRQRRRLPLMKIAARGFFTLLELLVALAVFAIMAIAAYGGLRNVLFTRAAVEGKSRRLAAVQLAVYRMEQDVEQTLARGIRDEYGDPQPALQGGALASDALTLTRAGWDNPLGQSRATCNGSPPAARGSAMAATLASLGPRGLIEPRETLLLDRVQELRCGSWMRTTLGKTTGHRPPPATMAKPDDMVPWFCPGRWK